jgi:hypothetical protein
VSRCGWKAPSAKARWSRAVTIITGISGCLSFTRSSKMGNLSVAVQRLKGNAHAHKERSNSLSKKVKDLQFGHKHFHLFESEETLLHFCSINSRQVLWLKGFA